MNRKVYLGIGILAILGMLAMFYFGLFYSTDPQKMPSVLLNKPAKNFNTITYQGQKISLKQFIGKPVVLNFWASWCVSCRAEARLLEAAHQAYTPKGAVFIGIAVNDKAEDSIRFIKRYGKTYLLGPDDENGSIFIAYGVGAVPETFFIDKQGIIRKKILGPVTPKQIQDFLNTELNL
ncbi:MAG: cytochrome c biogenesis protein CcmG/thiol:disulfide interchange protein DsbE [bacterium]|jgi:cytochrome c biogenesis protein CcmG/thiol:disulfide interchange protein DsbE